MQIALLVSAGFCTLPLSLLSPSFFGFSYDIVSRTFLLPSSLISYENTVKQFFFNVTENLLVKWSRRKHLNLRDYQIFIIFVEITGRFSRVLISSLFLKALPFLPPYLAKFQSLCSFSSHHFPHFLPL